MEQIIIKKKKFIVKNNIKMYNIDIDQIYFFEKFERKIEVVIKNRRISYYGSFIELAEIINKYSFIQCHKSYIVNYKKIFMIDKDEITFFDIKDKAYISKSHRENLINIIIKNERSIVS